MATRRAGAELRSELQTIYKRSNLYRICTQPPDQPSRAIAFNPNSDGRASPVYEPTGDADPAMYCSIDAIAGAIAEFLYHSVLKHYPPNSVIPVSKFRDVYFVDAHAVSHEPIKLSDDPILFDYVKEVLGSHGILVSA